MIISATFDTLEFRPYTVKMHVATQEDHMWLLGLILTDISSPLDHINFASTLEQALDYIGVK